MPSNRNPRLRRSPSYLGRVREPRRHPSYYLVAGIDLRREMTRLRALAVFADGPLATRRHG